jgi:hypothetical protein
VSHACGYHRCVAPHTVGSSSSNREHDDGEHHVAAFIKLE